MNELEVTPPSAFTATAAGTAERVTAFLRKVYGWMFVGLGITATVALGVASSPGIVQALVQNQLLFWGLFIAELGLVFYLSARVDKIAPATASGLFLLYSALNGVTLSLILLVYTGTSIATTFAVTAGMFGALALYGTTTKRSLAGIGQFMFMGLIGLVLASVVGMFGEVRRPAVRHLGRRRSRVHGPDGLGRPAAQGDGGSGPRGADRLLRRRRGPLALSRLHQPVPVPAPVPGRTARLAVASARPGSAACGGTGLRLACGLDRRPDPSLAAAPAARGVLRCARGDSSRRVQSHQCRSPIKTSLAPRRGERVGVRGVDLSSERGLIRIVRFRPAGGGRCPNRRRRPRVRRPPRP